MTDPQSGEAGGNGQGDDDAWIDQLDARPAVGEAIADVPGPGPAPGRAPEPSVGDDRRVAGREPQMAPARDVELASIERGLADVLAAVARLADRIDAVEGGLSTLRSAPPAGSDGSREIVVQAGFDQEALDEVVTASVRSAILKAQATGSSTGRLETEVRVLEETTARLAKRVGDLNLAAFTRDRTPDHSEAATQLATAADDVKQQLANAIAARQAFDVSVQEMIRRAADGEDDGESVAWTDVMFLAHELRSRLDDLDQQERRVLRELGEWQDEVDARLSAVKADLVAAVIDEIRKALPPAE